VFSIPTTSLARADLWSLAPTILIAARSHRNPDSPPGWASDCLASTILSPRASPLLDALLCRHMPQRYAATSDKGLHSYFATRFAHISPTSDCETRSFSKHDFSGVT